MSATKQWRAPTAEEFPIGIAELAKLIGNEEAASPTWTRRLALTQDSEDGKLTWLLVIEDAAGNDSLTPHLAVWTNPRLLESFPTAYPLGEAVEILRGPNNPETILAERRRAMKVHTAQVEAEEKQQREAEVKQRREAEQEERDRRRFGADRWDKLAPWQQAFFALALRVKDRDAALAADLRELAEEGMRRIPAALPFPRCNWDGR